MKMLGGAGSIGGIPFKGGIVSLGNADAAVLIGAASGLVKALVGVGAGALALILISAIAEEERIRKTKQIPMGVMSLVGTSKRKFVGIPLDSELEFECDGNLFKVALDRINEVKLAGTSYWIELIDGSCYEDVKILTKAIRFISVGGEQEVKIPSPQKIFYVGEYTKHFSMWWWTISLILTTIVTLGIIGGERPWEASGVRQTLIGFGGFIGMGLGTIMYFGIRAIWPSYDQSITRKIREGTILALSKSEYIDHEGWELEPRRILKIQGVSWENVSVLRQRLNFVLEHNAQAVINELGEDVFNQYFRYKPARTIST